MTAIPWRGGRARRRKPLRTHIAVFIVPAVAVYGFFMVYPLIDSMRVAFYASDAAGAETFVGLDNYERLLTEEPLWRPRFFGALKNSFIFFLINMFIQNTVALLLASLLDTKTRGGTLYRILIFTPAVLSLAIAGFVWELLLNPLWGVSDGIMEGVGLGSLVRPWLGDGDTALITLALISGWQYLGFPMMLYYASLINIPKDLVEAAYVDGATEWRVWRFIKLPFLMPMIGVISLLTFIGNFNAFDIIFTIKGVNGDPNYATDTMMTFFFRTFFGSGFQRPDPYMGAAVATTSFLFLLAAVLIYLIWRRRIEILET